MRTFRRRKDAESHKRKVESDDSAGLLIDPRGGDVIFGAYAEKWVETRLVRGRPLTPATAQGYRALLRRNLSPTFSATQLRKITPERVREWHSSVVSSAGPDQAAKSYRLLRAILNTALADDLIGRNPCRVAGAGIEHASERPILDTATVLDLSDTIALRLRAFVLLAGFGGLRTGELLGLQRQDVDFLRGVVQVRRQAYEITGRGRTVTEPKSEAGKRTVAIPRAVLEELRSHLDAYTDPAPSGVVFTRPSGRYLRRSDLSVEWKAACAKLGLGGVHPHDLRHHAATTMARIPGVTTRELMARIGHSSPRAALIYQHATEERDRAVADHLDTVIASTPRTARANVVNLPRDRRAMDSAG